MTKKIIWALFDSEANSCWNSLKFQLRKLDRIQGAFLSPSRLAKGYLQSIKFWRPKGVV